MKKIIAIAFTMVSVMAYSQEPVKILPLIPMPKEIKQLDDEFVMTNKTKVVLLNDKLKPEVDYLNNYLIN